MKGSDNMADLIDRNALVNNLELMAKYQPEHKQSTILGVCMTIKSAPTIDAVSMGVFEQVKWERDVAIAQLEELGIGFGQKKPDIQIVRHGYWKVIEESETRRLLECSECKEWILHNLNYISNYCSHCGAKMDLEVKS